MFRLRLLACAPWPLLVAATTAAEDAPKQILFYDAKKALEYAGNWCDGGNACTSGTGGQFRTDNNTDCTHFMSHVLFAGGVTVPGKDVKCDRGLCIRVKEMGDWFEEAAKKYANVKRINSRKETKAGDFALQQKFVFRLTQLQVGIDDYHVMLLADTAKEDHAVVYSHTRNLCGKPTATFRPETEGVFYRIEPGPMDGRWRSTDGDGRFELTIVGKSVRWKEYRKTGEGTTFERDAEFQETDIGVYELKRGNDDSTLQALGFGDPQLRAAILSRNPEPSTLSVRWETDKIVAQWRGLSVKKKPNGTLNEIVQPSQMLPKTFDFRKK